MAVTLPDPNKRPRVGANVAAAIQGYKPAGSTPVTAPVTTTGTGTGTSPVGQQPSSPGVTMPTTTGGFNPDKGFEQYGGRTSYIQKQLDRFKGADATLQGKINTDLNRFGVKAMPITGRPETPGFTTKDLTGATLGTENGQSFFTLPDGSREWVDTPEELTIANELGGYQSQLTGLQGQEQALLGQNQYDYTQALNQLQSNQAVDVDAAQQLQSRRGGFYSGGLDYQLGGIQRGYAQQRGDLAQDLNTRNAQLRAQYGSQADQLRSNIANLLSTAPGLIQQQVAAAAQAKRDANIKAAQDFYNTYGYAVRPQDDYSGFWRQVESGQAGLGQKETLEWNKYNAAQQKQVLESLWKAADNTGVISQELADLYPGVLQAGQQTRAAKEFAAQQGLRQDASDLNWIRENRLGMESSADDDAEEGGITGGTASDVLNNTLSEEYQVTDPETGEITTKTRLSKDGTKRDSAVFELVSAGITEKDLKNALLSSGAFTAEEVNKYIDAYKDNLLGKK